MNQSDYEWINIREYSIYFLRLCLINNNLTLDEIPNIDDLEKRTRQLQLTANDCQTIRKSKLINCLHYNQANNYTQFAHDWLSYLKIYCQDVIEVNEFPIFLIVICVLLFTFAFVFYIICFKIYINYSRN